MERIAAFLKVVCIYFVIQVGDCSKLCKDEANICFNDVGKLGYFTKQCNSSDIQVKCPYMCAACTPDLYDEASLYFPFDDLTDFSTGNVGDGISIVPLGRRNASLFLNNSSCIETPGFDNECVSDPGRCSGLTLSLYFAYSIPAKVNTDLTFFTSGGHNNSTGVYFGYDSKIKKFIVKVKSRRRQYSASFDESDIPSRSRLLMHLAVTCTTSSTHGILPSIGNSLNNIKNLMFNGKMNSQRYHEGLKVYIEGKLLVHEQNFTMETLTNTDPSIKIGCRDKGETWRYEIKVDEVAVWNRVLSPREVFALAKPMSDMEYLPTIEQLDSELTNSIINLETANSVVSSLQEVFATNDLRDGDVMEVVKLWSRLAAAEYAPSIQPMSLKSSKDKTTPSSEDGENLVKRVGKTIDKFLGESNREAVTNLSNHEPEALPHLVEAVDNFLGKVSLFSLSPDANGTLATTEIRETIEIRVKVDTNSMEEYEYEDGASAAIETPVNASGALLVNVLYKGVGSLFPTKHNITLRYKPELANNSRNNTYLKLSDDILGMSVYDDENYPASSIHYTFKLPRVENAEIYPHCVFLKFSNSSNGDNEEDAMWSDEGCTLVHSSNDSVACTCNHLTNFAVLMQVVSFELSKSDRDALEVITYIGCTLSIVGAVLTIVTFIFLRIYTERVLIHLNLAIAIICAQVLLFVEESIPRATTACTAVTMLLYYFNMAVFSWMLVEGTQLFLQIVVVFSSEGKMKIFYSIGWGIPFLLATISAACLNSSIGQHGVCWLSPVDNSIWAFAVPAILVISANLVILIAVMKVVVNLSKTVDQNKVTTIRNAIKASVFLLPLLGCTWLFGVMAISSETVVFQYLFAATNSLQGLMLFVCHCVFNSEVRDCFLRKKSTWDQGRQVRVEPIFYTQKHIGAAQPYCGRPRDGNETPSTDNSGLSSLPGSAKSAFRRR